MPDKMHHKRRIVAGCGCICTCFALANIIRFHVYEKDAVPFFTQRFKSYGTGFTKEFNFQCQPTPARFVFYNRLPKSGSSTLLNITKILSSKNDTFAIVGKNDPDVFYHPSEIRAMHDYIYFLESSVGSWRDKPAFACRHAHFFDIADRFVAPTIPRPIKYIQIVREPVALLLSFFYYDVYHRGAASYLALNRASRVIHGTFVNYSQFLAGNTPFIEFDECVAAMDRTNSVALPVCSNCVTLCLLHRITGKESESKSKFIPAAVRMKIARIWRILTKSLYLDRVIISEEENNVLQTSGMRVLHTLMGNNQGLRVPPLPCSVPLTLVPWFCGHDPLCADGRTPQAFQRAVDNYHRYHFVGLLEDMPASIRVLERTLPHYFAGAGQELLRLGRANAYPLPGYEEYLAAAAADGRLDAVRRRLEPDVRLYEYIRADFRRRLAVCDSQVQLSKSPAAAAAESHGPSAGRHGEDEADNA